MSLLDKVTLNEKYNNASTGRFKAGQSKGIGSDDFREMMDDHRDSHFNLIDHKFNGAGGTKSGINTIAGIKALITTDKEVGITVTFRDTGTGNVLRVYELVTGTDVESSPDVLRPHDYAASTNERVWKLAVIGAVVPDGSDTTKGKWESTDQTESEAVASAGSSAGADHTRVITGRGLWWFWAKIKTLAQTWTAAITATDFISTNQAAAAGKKNPLFVDDTGKHTKQTFTEIDTANQRVTHTGSDNTTWQQRFFNLTGDLILEILNNRSVKFDGTTSFIRVLSTISSGLAGLIMNANQAIGYYFGDGTSTLMKFRTTTGDKAAVFAMKYEQDSSLGFVTQVRQYSAMTGSTAAATTLIAAIPIASGVSFEINIRHAKAKNSTFRQISCNTFKCIGSNNAGTLTGVNETITMLRQTATTGGWSVTYNDTLDQVEIYFTNETGTGYAYDCDIQLSICLR